MVRGKKAARVCDLRKEAQVCDFFTQCSASLLFNAICGECFAFCTVQATYRLRNRASPCGIVKTYDRLTSVQRRAISEMGFGSLLDIKCHTLHNPLIFWLVKLYDPESRELVIPTRGRIPLSEDSVERIMGIPHGSDDVIYRVDSEVQDRLVGVLFGKDVRTPKTTRVCEIIGETRVADGRFKRLWMMYAICTLLSPTSLNKVSNRVYPILVGSI